MVKHIGMQAGNTVLLAHVFSLLLWLSRRGAIGGVVLVARGNCSFVSKGFQGQESGALGVVIG